MRRLLLIPLLALAFAPATAAAQLDESDLPEIPDVPVLGPEDLPELPARKKAQRATFKVSLYGIQRYAVEERKTVDDPTDCWNQQGSSTHGSVARFSTRRPTRATVTKMPGGLAMIQLHGGDGDIAMPVKASFQHRGSAKLTMIDCLNLTAGWQPIPPPEERNCAADLSHLGFDLGFEGRGVLEASGQESIVAPIVDPFEGCPWGDRSGTLYTARQRISVGDLLRSEETEVVLRMRERDPLEGYENITGETRRQTTIYVIFKRVGRR